MPQFDVGDRVRIDLPDESDPDYERFHGEHGTILNVIEDDAETVTGDRRDSHLYRVEIEQRGTIDLRWRDLRPPIE